MRVDELEHSKLLKALDELDILLLDQGLPLEIVICGAFAIFLQGYLRAQYTLDIDSVTKLNDPKVLNSIEEVSRKLGLHDSWLNDQASTVALPDGIFQRAKPIGKWKAIRAFVVDRADLIKMKALAFSIRRDFTNKDWEDLVLLSPTKSEIESAISFISQVGAPPEGSSTKIYAEFQETINDLRKLAP